ncbi:MAG TPA: BatD family protein [Candidatus Omnitrophota bacterium]|nr:BatD family protein [Candidatus Omnitrophota bacterium]
MIRFFRYIAFIVVFCAITSLSLADDLSFQATVDANRVTLDSVVRLSLTIVNAQPSSLELPSIDGFESRYIGPATQVSIINGQVTKSITHNYSLFPTKTGTFQIPALSITIDGKTLTSQAISIEVVDAQTQVPSQSTSQEGSAEKLEDKIFLILEKPRSDIYLGEKILVTIKLFVRGVSLRDIEFPEFDKAYVACDDYRQPNQYQKIIKGLSYDVVEFNIDCYATQLGTRVLGPATLKANLLYKTQKQRPSSFDSFFGDSGFFDNFFDRSEKRPLAVRSQSETINILPLTEQGRPEDFSGGVGKFYFKMTASPLEVKAGDPITVVMNVSGEGNLKTVQLPAFKDTNDFKVYDPQIKEINGTKILEQVIIPKSEKVTAIPAVVFSYFDVGTKQYQTITQGPFPLKVEAPAEGQSFKIIEPSAAITPFVPQEEKLGRDLIFIKESIGPLQFSSQYFYNSFLLKILYALITIVFFVFYFYKIISNHLKKDVALARKLAAPQKARIGMKRMKQLINQQETKDYYDCLFKTLQEYFKDKFHLSSAMVSFTALEEIFKNKKVPQIIIDRVQRLFQECDEVRFASVAYNAEKVKASFNLCEEIIDYFERNVR